MLKSRQMDDKGLSEGWVLELALVVTWWQGTARWPSFSFWLLYQSFTISGEGSRATGESSTPCHEKGFVVLSLSMVCWHWTNHSTVRDVTPVWWVVFKGDNGDITVMCVLCGQLEIGECVTLCDIFPYVRIDSWCFVSNTTWESLMADYYDIFLMWG